MTRDGGNGRSWATWVSLGIVLVACEVALAWLSNSFEYGADRLTLPMWPLVGLMVGAGVVYLACVWRLDKIAGQRRLWIWIVIVGAAMRLAMLPSTIILEDDIYRYLWDGAMVAHGRSPYAVAPLHCQPGDPAFASQPAAIQRMAVESGPVVARVNHPQLRSIYPSVGQCGFALAYVIKPWSVVAWRAVLLAADVATLALLAMLLRQLGRPAVWLAVYWWNPLVVKEIFNSGHMDAVILPFVLGAILLAMRGWATWAVPLAAVGAGVKVWPVLLLPLLARPLLRNAKRLLVAVVVSAVVLGMAFGPLVWAGLNGTSGMVAYGATWQANDALFKLLIWGVLAVGSPLGVTWSIAFGIARVMLLLAMLGWALAGTVRPMAGRDELVRRCLWIVGGLFVLSATQFPWYFVWVVPLLALRMNRALLLYTALLPLYYLRYTYEPRGQLAVFEHGVVFVEHVPVWLMLGWQWWTSRRQPAATM